MNTVPAARASSPWSGVLGVPAAGITAIFCLLVIWLRTGLVPAASGGDEIWWSESAWHWLHEGVLRWACFDDDKGSALVSYWPPTAPLLQAAMISLFGLPPFGIMAQSALVCTLLMVLVFLLGRTGGLSVALSLWAAVALFGLLLVDRRLMQVRMENLTALSGLAGLWLLLRIDAGRSDRANFSRALAAGAVTAAGLFCYYPQSPFLLLGLAGAFALLPHPRKLPLAGALLAGALPVLAATAAWIWPHRDLFARQMLDVGTSHYLAAGHFARAFGELLDFPSGLRWWQNLEKWTVLVFALAAWRMSRALHIRTTAVLTAASSLPMFFYDNPPQVLAGILGVLLLFLLGGSPGKCPAGRFLAGLQGLLVAATVLKLALVGYTAWAQREGRDYRPVAEVLTTLVRPSQRVAVTQEGWLALRAHPPATNLHVLPYTPPSTENRPRVARTAAAADYYDCLVLQRSHLPELREVYPWLGPALDSGQFREVRSITPALTPLPWAGTPNYDLIVFFRRGVSPGGEP